jgi:hypothetical protein
LAQAQLLRAVVAERFEISRQPLAIWLQAAGMLLAAIGIVACLAAFAIDAINFWIGVAA